MLPASTPAETSTTNISTLIASTAFERPRLTLRQPVIAREHTALTIAHRLSTIVDADQILVLEHGRIVERGAHSELLAADGVYDRTWRLQQDEDRAAPDRTSPLAPAPPPGMTLASAPEEPAAESPDVAAAAGREG